MEGKNNETWNPGHPREKAPKKEAYKKVWVWGKDNKGRMEHGGERHDRDTLQMSEVRKSSYAEELKMITNKQFIEAGYCPFCQEEIAITIEKGIIYLECASCGFKSEIGDERAEEIRKAWMIWRGFYHLNDLEAFWIGGR